MIAVQLVIAGIFVVAGAVDGFTGRLAMLLMTCSCGVLAYSYLESERAGHAIEGALRTGLGDDYESRIEGRMRDAFHREPRWSELRRPFKARHPEVEKITGIRFDRQRGIDLELDIYRHRSMPDRCPGTFSDSRRRMGDRRQEGASAPAHEPDGGARLAAVCRRTTD